MKAKSAVNTSCATIVAVCCLVLAAGCTDRRSELRLIEPRLSIDRKIATEFATLMQDRSSVSVTLVPSVDATQTGIEALLADIPAQLLSSRD